ncbi:MAG: hypothetical protein KHW87_02190 [Clostridiales bacterium]|nr:hypothetical protein [Clostridiales bacterium]
MNRIRSIVGILCGTVLVSLSLGVFSVLAANDVSTTEQSQTETVCKEYTIQPESVQVDSNQLFSQALSEEDETVDVDILIHGQGAEFYFSYDSIFRNTGRWGTFTAQVTVTESKNGVLPKEIKDALTNTSALYLDFADGEHYPGTARVTVFLPEVFAQTRVDVYEVLTQTDGSTEEETEKTKETTQTDEGDKTDRDDKVSSDTSDVSLSPIATDLLLGDDAAFVQMLTESHDYLLVPANTGEGIDSLLAQYCRDVVIATPTSPFQGVSVTALILLGILVLFLIGALILGIVLLVRGVHKKDGSDARNKQKALRAPAVHIEVHGDEKSVRQRNAAKRHVKNSEDHNKSHVTAHVDRTGSNQTDLKEKNGKQKSVTNTTSDLSSKKRTQSKMRAGDTEQSDLSGQDRHTDRKEK